MLQSSTMDSYVVGNSLTDVCAVLDFSKKSKAHIIGIQQLGDREPVKLKCLVEAVDPKKGFFYLRANSDVTQSLDKDFALMLRFKNRGLIFKTMVDAMVKNRLRLKLPTDYRIIENRAEQRQDFKSGRQKCVAQKEGTWNAGGQGTINLEVMNISKNGIALKVNSSKINQFKLEDTVNVLKLGLRDLKSPIVCKVVHITEIKKENELDMFNLEYRVGLAVEKSPVEDLNTLFNKVVTGQVERDPIG